jgi:tRNA (guanine-N7-)-methyltransferase
LTGPAFLDKYERFLKERGKLHLKTDNEVLYQHTREVLKERGCPVERDMPDVHEGLNELPEEEQEWLRIRTFYEKMALEKGSRIKYIRFRLK